MGAADIDPRVKVTTHYSSRRESVLSKTLALEAALSMVGAKWADDGMISKVTGSAIYEHLSKTGSLPIIWDDPPRGEYIRELDEFCKAIYNAKPRVVRGNRQIPHSPIGFTSNHMLGGEHDAAFTRFARVPFYADGSTQAIPELKKAMKVASGSFQELISIGYHPEEINAIETEFLVRLPLAHNRIAWNLALIVFYAEKLVELVGGCEQPRSWALANLTPIENDADNAGDPIADFIRCIQALEGKDALGSWDKRLFTDEHGEMWVAIHPGSVWSEVQKAFNPATYNQKSLKAHLVKIGGVVDKAVRFHASRDEVLAYNRATLTAKCDAKGNSIQPNPPKKKMKKAWLIPLNLFGIDPDIDPGDEPPDPPTDDKPGNGSGGSGNNSTDLGDIPTDTQPVPNFETVETAETTETRETSNWVSSLDDATAGISSLKPLQGNPEIAEVEIEQANTALVSDIDEVSVESADKLVEASLHPVSAVSLTSTTNFQGLQPETPLGFAREHSVSFVSEVSNSAVATSPIKDSTPRTLTLRRASGTLIELPAEYPGSRGRNQTKEPRLIAKLLRAMTQKADWETIVNKYGEVRVLWVWRWHFNQLERLVLNDIIVGNCEQGKLDL